MTEQPKHEVVIAHGKNWRKYPPRGATPESFNLQLSPESRMTAIAAWELYSQGRAEKVLFSTGKTAGESFPSEARAMRKYLRDTGRLIPEDATLFEEISFDTPGNAEESKKVLERNGLADADIAILTVKDHVKRTANNYQNEDVTVTASYASEDLVEQVSDHHAHFIQRYSHSLRRRIEQTKEVFLRAENKLDKNSKVLRVLTRKLRRQ